MIRVLSIALLLFGAGQALASNGRTELPVHRSFEKALARRLGTNLPKYTEPWLMERLRSGFVHTPVPEPSADHGRFVQQTRVPEIVALLWPMPQPKTPPTLEPAEPAFEIPLSSHPLVAHYIHYFTGSGRWFFEKWIARFNRYAPIMTPILQEYGVPKDLIYLAMVESGFNIRAKSTASALGPWQFIRSTGRLYKLKNNRWYDDRLDFITATHAAARHLRDLYRQFDDWHLAWAAYNAGPGRITRALKRYRVDSFWDLVDRPKSLAKETRHYVPKIIAAAIVAKSSGAYGFENVPRQTRLSYATISVPSQTSLRRVAKATGTSLSHIETLNPSLLLGKTPPGRRWQLRVPKNTPDQVLAALRSPNFRARKTAQSPAPKPDTGRSKTENTKPVEGLEHRVKPGETLWGIASAYATNVDELKRLNNMDENTVRIGAVLIVRGPSPEPKPSYVTVASGETLWRIAQRHGIAVSSLMQWNGIDEPTDLLAGRRLRISPVIKNN